MWQQLLKMSLKLLSREFRQRELKILFMATMVSVATVSLISLMGSHLQRLIVQSSSQFIAADRQLQSPRVVPDGWLEKAHSMNVDTAKALTFASMLFADDETQLVSVKAVSEKYPLRGSLETAMEPFGSVTVTQDVPSPGTIWLNPRLFSLLSIENGASVSIGDKEFIVGRVLVREPDVSFGMSALAPRAMINLEDIEATGVVQPGSRLSWRYLFSGNETGLKALELWLKPKLASSQKWIGVKEGRPAIANSIDKAETYLLLGGSLAVLLACVAIAMSSMQFASKQVDTVALLKTLGLSGSKIIAVYAFQVAFLGLFAGFAGTLVGVGAFAMSVYNLGVLFPELSNSLAWYDIQPTALLVGWLTGIIVMAAFALPPIVKLKQVSPMNVLRRDVSEGSAYSGWIWGIGVVGVFSLLYLYSGDWLMVAILLCSLLALSLLLLVFSYFIIKGVSLVGTQANSFWRLGISSVVRRRWQSVFQIQVFSLALMLLAIIYLTRTSLLGDWQAQLPVDAPNHFLINIAETQVEEVQTYFDDEGVNTSGLYPMIRGRLTHINGVPVKVAVSKDKEVNALNRELNLTWSDTLPTDNKIEQGAWWYGDDNQEKARVSVESKLAEKIGVVLGDQLMFTIGDQQIEVEIQSIRSVEWDSMRPNFYMIFPDGLLEGFSSTHITSVYLGPEQKSLLNTFSRRFPTVTVLEVDQLIAKIRTIINQVSMVVELIMYLILGAAILVVAALINISMGERYREGALLRTLGAKSKLIQGGQFVEFGVIGFVSGLVGVTSAEIVVWIIQQKLFNAPFIWHMELWLWLPIISGLLIGMAGYYLVRKVTTLPPLVILRQGSG